jgi:hypothetical protein
MHHRNRHRAWAPLFIALAIPLAGGCGSDNRREESTQERVDRLRSLPYVDLTSEPVSDNETGTVHYDSTQSQPGYNFYTVRGLARAELVDASGDLIRSWQGPVGLWMRAMLLPDGDVLAVGFDDRRYAMRMTWTGDVVWRWNIEAHHDIGLTSDGRVMLLAFHTRIISKISETIPVRDDFILILSDDGEVVEAKSLFDMMSAAGFEFLPIQPHPTEGHIDLFHANSLQWMVRENLFERDRIYESGNIMVSIRHQNTVAIFDWDKEEMIWEWGRGEISGQHDAQVLEDGNILIFDNGIGRDWSRVIELDPLARTIVWEYSAPEKESFYTLGRGANQRLANGNTLITQSDSGRAFEVTPDGDIVWDFLCPHVRDQRRATLVRCYRYDISFVNAIRSVH